MKGWQRTRSRIMKELPFFTGADVHEKTVNSFRPICRLLVCPHTGLAQFDTNHTPPHSASAGSRRPWGRDTVPVAAAYTTRSLIVGMPSGRSPPPGFGIISRRTGSGLYVFTTTRSTLPACRARYPGGSRQVHLSVVPCPRGLPLIQAGPASAISLSSPAQASLALRTTGLLNRPRRPLSRGFGRAVDKAARQLPDQTDYCVFLAVGRA
jgi:hypothetical protein